jgi:aminoglycoside phosphotransferase (APT) family kinase protein
MPETDIPCIATHQIPTLSEAHIHEHRKEQGEKEKRWSDKWKGA